MYISSLSEIKEKIKNIGFKPKFVLGYTMPSVDFRSVCSALRSELGSECILVLSSSAGLLCNYDQGKNLSNMYGENM